MRDQEQRDRYALGRGPGQLVPPFWSVVRFGGGTKKWSEAGSSRSQSRLLKPTPPETEKRVLHNSTGPAAGGPGPAPHKWPVDLWITLVLQQQPEERSQQR